MVSQSAPEFHVYRWHTHPSPLLTALIVYTALSLRMYLICEEYYVKEMHQRQLEIVFLG